jgi:hypothetical protein
MIQILIRFVVGGTAVSVFALVGDVLKPKSFADCSERHLRWLWPR